jgi:mannose-6-phosphate isomerase-like protein (cupin superfamily)
LRGNGYQVRHVTEAPTVPCSCGESTRILAAADGLPCSLHVTHIRDAAKHYHRVTTEVYYVLEGTGRMELGDDVIELTPGTVVYLEPGTPHRAWGDVKTIVFGLPAFRAEDEFYVGSATPPSPLAPG